MLIDLSYLRYPLPPDVQRLFEAGEFSRMERVIAARLADSRTPETLKKRLTFQLAIAREIPASYPLTRSALLAQLQGAVRDFMPEELEAPVEQGQTLGKAAVYQGKALLEEYEVRAAADAPRMTVRDAIGLLWQSLTGAA